MRNYKAIAARVESLGGRVRFPYYRSGHQAMPLLAELPDGSRYKNYRWVTIKMPFWRGERKLFSSHQFFPAEFWEKLGWE